MFTDRHWLPDYVLMSRQQHSLTMMICVIALQRADGHLVVTV